MAKIQLQNFLKKITINKEDDKKNPKKIKLYNKLTSLTKLEFENIKNDFFTPNKSDNINNISINDLNSIFLKTFNKITESKLSYAKLCTLEPKIEQAETIIIPSILSPNSLKNYNLKFTFSDNINNIIKDSPELNNEILEKINTFINTQLQLHKKIDIWLKEALFSVGSKPILIIPPKVITNLRDDTISFEDYQEQFINDNLSINIEEITKSTLNKTINESDSLYYDLNELFNKKLTTKQNNTFLNNLTTVISQEVKNNIIISDKVENIILPKKSKQIKYKSFIDKYNAWYNKEDLSLKPKIKNDSLLNILDFININDINDTSHPLLLEIPSESILPITDKDNPSIHYCYLMLLDDDNVPLSTNSNIDNNILNPNNNLTLDLTNKIYNSSMNKSNNLSYFFGKNIEKETKHKVTQMIYEKYINNMILSTSKQIGITNINFEIKNDILKTMFYRLLKHRKTKLIIIPNFLLTYIAFKYDNDGIGISKTKEISFILSMKLTYLITRLYKMIDQGIDTKNIKVGLNKKINNPLEFLQSLKDVLIQNKSVNFSYDPTKIIKDLTNRHINIIANNIPGIDSFEIDKENSQTPHNMVDTELIEIFDNMLTTLLEVPPSAYNELSENEYARSLTTINILFDLKMSKKRKILSDHISKLIQNYFMFDYKFQKELNTFITKKLGITNNKKSTELINNIISSLQLTLPESNISFDEAEFELADKYMDFVDKLIENIFPKELITDSDSQDFFENLTTHIKSSMVKKYLNKSNLVLHIDDVLDDIKTFNIENLLDFQKVIANYKKATDTYNEKIAKIKENNSGY